MEYKELQSTLEAFVGKWKPIIIYHLLKEGTKRYSELQKLIPEINKRMLTLRLRELEADKIIKRKVYQEVPPKVEYSITEYGKSLEPVLSSMNNWGKDHITSEDNKIISTEDNPENVCQALTTINLIVGKWKPIIITELLENEKRFSELQRNIPSINKRMLTNDLRELEQEGIINREVYQQVPPKVVYSITEYGKTLEAILLQLNSWGREHTLSK
ncbi:winged helix-turn-helix transcriptional regulator [Bacillus sp. UNC41MFS5]|uniref:winged helix-turn-helix transcriptional regulator n=1 Tax=Bacillus sp. UNC41MFS5 TaxID=1449046 RepID=UPI00054F7156